MLLLIFNLPLISCFTDLRRFRTYKGSHVRDLLRAMRNKVIIKSCQYNSISILNQLSLHVVSLLSAAALVELFPSFQFLSKRGAVLTL